MVEVYVVYSGSLGRVDIPGGPFPNMEKAHDALEEFAVLQHGTCQDMRRLLLGYCFVVRGGERYYVSLRT
jgi:hypothetical protein